MRIVLRAKKCMRGEINGERENNGLRGKIKGTRTKEENKRLRCEIKGADRAKGENKMHDRDIKCEGVKQRITGEIKGHKREGRK